MTTQKLYLKTMFCCMACDGKIESSEIDLIKQVAKNECLFGSIDIESELNLFVSALNKSGKNFLDTYLKEIGESDLNEKQELQILQIAAKVILADENIDYNEVKFFKLIRYKMKISDETILKEIKDIDYNWLAQDIKSDYLLLYSEYFNNIKFGKFDLNNIETSKNS